MGMYTELHYNVELNTEEGVDDVIRTLRYMTQDEEYPVAEDWILRTQSHELFHTNTRWQHMLRMDSYYFPHKPASRVYEDQGWYLNVRCNLKNYDNEIEKFVDWIDPFVELHGGTDRFLGFKRYESEHHPTLIYKGPVFFGTDPGW